MEAGPDFRRVHIPDAAPGQETLLVEVEARDEGGRMKEEAPHAGHVVAFILIIGMMISAFGGPLLDALSSISQNWRHIPTGIKTVLVPEHRPSDPHPTAQDQAYTDYRRETHALLEDLRKEKRAAAFLFDTSRTRYGFTKLQTKVNTMVEQATAESESHKEGDAMKVATLDRARVLRIFLDDLKP